ncbi:unnamed protein product, partial [Brassica oleracea var. botrytis]
MFNFSSAQPRCLMRRKMTPPDQHFQISLLIITSIQNLFSSASYQYP